MDIRQYKILYQIFNFFNRSQLKHNIPLFKKYGMEKNYFSSISSEDFRELPASIQVKDAEQSAIEMADDENFKSLETSVQSALSTWSKNGYAILNSFFSEQEIDRCNDEVENLIKKGKVKFRYGNKIMFAFHHSSLIENMGANEKLLKILQVIMGKKVELFQSINFIEGSQQRTHSDSIHMTTFPYGNLIAVWVALEDITMESGPLHYFPGSHTLPYVMNRDYGNIGTKYKLGEKSYHDYENHIAEIITKNDLKKEVFLAKKGDLLIWHANLLHGGEKVIDEKSTRKSMVFHYYADQSICFHEITQRPTLKRELAKSKRG